MQVTRLKNVFSYRLPLYTFIVMLYLINGCLKYLRTEKYISINIGHL